MNLLMIAAKRCLRMLGGKLCAGIVILLCLVAYAVLGDILSDKAADTPCFALVDRDQSEISLRVGDALSTDDGLRLVSTDAAEADKLLRLGRAEGIFTLEAGFGEALLQGEIKASFTGTAGSNASEFGRSLLYAKILRERTRLQVSDRWDVASFDAAYAKASAAVGGAFTVNSSGGSAEALGAGGVFEGLFARSLGVVILFISFLQLYMAQWAASNDAIRVRKRLLSIRGGLIKELFCTLAALFFGGAILSVIALLFLPDLQLRGLLLLLFYSCVNASVCLLIALYQRQNGKVDAAIPLLALIGAFLGGCLFSWEAISPVLGFASYFTPQGLALHLADGQLFCLPLLAGIGLLFPVLARISVRA